MSRVGPFLESSQSSQAARAASELWITKMAFHGFRASAGVASWAGMDELDILSTPDLPDRR